MDAVRSPSGPTVRQASGVGALVGACCGAWMVALQNASAAVAGMLWTVEHPWLNFPLYAAVGATAGGLAAAALEGGRRLVAGRWIDGWSWLVAWLGAGVYLARPCLQVARRWLLVGKYGASHALLVVVGALLVLLTLVLARRRPPRNARAAFAEALALALPVTAAALSSQLFFETFRADRWGLARLAIGVVAVLVGRGLAPVASRRRLGWRRITALAVLGGSLAAGLALQTSSRQEPPTASPSRRVNVLVVVLDTLRRDAVSAYGLVEGTTPHLDRFAAAGTLWEDAYAPAIWTTPSHASLFTGAWVTRHGAGRGQPALRSEPVAGALPLPTMAESFAARGWSTAAFVSNPNLNGVRGFDRGFTEFYAVWKATRNSYDPLGQNLARWFDQRVEDRGGERTVELLHEWWSGRGGGRPWFVFVNMLEAHHPYSPPPPWLGRFSGGGVSRAEARRLSSHNPRFRFGGAPVGLVERLWPLYLDAVAYQDHLLGRMLTALDASGHAEDTVVVVTSDHGENFGWRGQLDHAGTTNEDLLRIPLVARGPGIPVGRRIGGLVSLVDVFPTLLHLTGGRPLPPDPGRSGVVLPPMGGSADALAGRRLIAEVLPAQRGGGGSLAPGADLQLLDGEHAVLLVGDWAAHEMPAERRLTVRGSRARPPEADGTRAVIRPRVERALFAELHAMRARWPRVEGPGAAAEPMDPATRAGLAALGYIQ